MVAGPPAGDYERVHSAASWKRLRPEKLLTAKFAKNGR